MINESWQCPKSFVTSETPVYFGPLGLHSISNQFYFSDPLVGWQQNCPEDRVLLWVLQSADNLSMWFDPADCGGKLSDRQKQRRLICYLGVLRKDCRLERHFSIVRIVDNTISALNVTRLATRFICWNSVQAEKEKVMCHIQLPRDFSPLFPPMGHLGPNVSEKFARMICFRKIPYSPCFASSSLYFSLSPGPQIRFFFVLSDYFYFDFLAMNIKKLL